MKRKYNFVTVMLLFMLSFSLFAQEDADISKNKTKENEKIQLDFRIDNMGYWMKMAEKGLVPYNPSIPVKPAEYKGSMISGKGVQAQDSPDVAVSNATNLTESENSIFVDPNDNQYILNSNNSTSWNGSSVGTLYGANYFQSANGGSSWGGSYQGAGGSNSGDPATAINNSGRQFVNYINNASGQGIAYSDNGSSWSTATIAPNPGSLADKNHMWIDNSSTSPYEGNLYCAWTDFGGSYDSEVVFSKSTNNGSSWSTRVPISGSISTFDHGVNLQTGPAGEVYACWATYPSSGLTENGIGFAKSTNGGSSFGAATKVISTIQGIRQLETTKNMRVNSFPVMAVDISGGPNNGNIYIVWSNYGDPNNSNSGTNISVYMIRSTNGGTSWTSPIRVNQGPTSNGYEAYSPWISADPETGAISVVYYEDRDMSSHPTTSCEAWVSYSTDAGNNWTAMRVSDVSFTPSSIPGLASGYMGDYLGITSKGGRVYPCWTDTRGGLYMTYVSPFVIGLNANFTADATNICTGSSVTFTDVSSGAPATYSWTFTGGTPSTATGAGPHNITYSTPGTYNVSLTVTDGGSGTDTELKVGYITVENVIADFTGTPTTVVVGNTVTFTDNSACGPTSWNWTFPGGTPGTATGSGPHTITYNTVGTYNVTLAVTSGANNDTETKTNYIDVINCNYCTSSYSNTSDDYVSNVSFNTINNPSGSTNYSDFTSISTNVTTGNTYSVSANITVNGNWIQHCWVWIDWNRDCDFDDAGEAFDLGQTPGTSGTHTLSTNITVPSSASIGSTRMRVSELYNTNPGPCTVSTYGEAEDYTVVIQSSAISPVAEFSADNTAPAVGQTVNLTDLSTGSPTSWSWSFNPTTITYVSGTSSSSQNPQVQFNSSGYYSVTLTATNTYGSDDEIKTNYILAGTAGNWTGATSTDWGTASNWETLAIPNNTDNVTIPASATNYPVYTGNFALGTHCNDMTLEGNASFISTGDMTIPAGRSLSCNGTNDISVAGDWNNYGTFSPGAGTVTLNGIANTVIDATGIVNSSLQTTFAGGNGSNGNMFDIVAINEVTVTSFDGNLDPGTGDVHIYYKTGTYVGSETNSSAWTLVGTVSTTSTGNGSATPIPLAVNVTIPAGQTYAFYVHAENGNAYTNGSTAGNVYVSDANMQILEGNGRGNPLFTGGIYSPRVFNGIVHYSYGGGSGSVIVNNLVIDKSNAEVQSLADVNLNGDFTINPMAYFTNGTGNTFSVTGNTTFKADANGTASFINNGTSSFSNDPIVESYISQDQWHMVSAPVNNAQSIIFVGLYLMEFNEPTYTWNYITPLNHDLSSGRGFMAWSASGSTGNATVNYNGPLNNGNINVTGLSYTASQPIAERGWNMVGNPYPSSTNWNSNWGRTNIDATAYIYDGVNYLTWNGTTGTHPNGDIAPGQGFFVKANASGASLTIPQGERKHSSQGFYKEGGQLNELFFTVEGNGYSDKMIVQFNDEATAGFDSGFDAWKFRGKEAAPQMYSVYGNNQLTVNSLPFEGENMTIPVSFEAGTNGQFTISLSGLDDFDGSNEIWLEDILENKMIDLLEVSSYSFNANSSDDANRFLLHFGNPLGMEDNGLLASDIYSFADRVYIQKPVGFNGQVSVYDMLGQEILSQKETGEGLMSIPIKTGTGYYFVKVQSDNSIVTEKVFIK